MEAKGNLRPKDFRNNAINFKLKQRFRVLLLLFLSPFLASQNVTERINETKDTNGACQLKAKTREV